MQFQSSPAVIPLLIAALASIWVAYFAISRRGTLGAVFLSLLSISITIWLLGYTLEILGADLATKLFWAKFTYLGISTAPLMWFFFAFTHANQDKMFRPLTRAMLGIIPCITIGFAFTNDQHGLIWQTVNIFHQGSFSALRVTYGPWFWVHWVFAYIMLALGTVYILRSIGGKKGLYRGQTQAMFAAVIFPWVGNLIYILRLGPIPNLDLTPFMFALTLVALTWGILGFQLINLAPFARDFVMDHMEDGLIVFDRGDQITDINPAALRILNQPDQRAIGRKVHEIFSAQPWVIQRYLKGEDELGEVVMEQEKPVWYDVRASRLANRRNLRVGRVITIHNVTEQKRAEEQQARLRDRLLRQNEYLSLLHQVTLDLLNKRDLADLLSAIVDRISALLNAPFVEIMLKEGDYLVARSVSQNQTHLRVNLPSTREEVPLSWQAHDSGAPAVVEDYSTWMGGQQIYRDLGLRATACIPVLTGSRCTAVLVTARTEPGPAFTAEEIQTGKLFAQLVALAMDNANLYQSAVAEIMERKRTEDALIVARDQALEASQLKTQLLARMSHELRTPLNAIQGFSELLQFGTFGTLDDKQKEATGQIIENTRYLTDLVNDLLDEAQISAKKLVLQMTPVDLPGLLRRVGANLTGMAKQKDLQFSLAIAPNLPDTICTDEGRLQQILLNLGGNAVRFTSSGKIWIETFRQDMNHWGFKVGDTGCGIPKDVQPLIFEPFFQLDRTGQSANLGAGLGLTITKQLVDLMGGKILVESDDGTGSVFMVLLPLIEDLDRPRGRTGRLMRIDK